MKINKEKHQGREDVHSHLKVNLIKKTDRQYKTKPRFHERRTTDAGLCIWQLNKMLRGTGYKIERLGKIQSVVELLLVPTGYKDVETISPFTGCYYVRHYSHTRTYSGYDSIKFWNRVINRMLEARHRSKKWLVEEFKQRIKDCYPNIHERRKRAEELYLIHYDKYWSKHYNGQTIV